MCLHHLNNVTNGTRYGRMGGRMSLERESLGLCLVGRRLDLLLSLAWITLSSDTKNHHRWFDGTRRSLPCRGQILMCPPTIFGTQSPRALLSLQTQGHKQCVIAYVFASHPAPDLIVRIRAGRQSTDRRTPRARNHHHRAGLFHRCRPIRLIYSRRHALARRSHIRAVRPSANTSPQDSHHPPTAPPHPLRTPTSQTPIRRDP